MKQSLSQPIPQLYPEWHNQPLHLSSAEMENPSLVLETFFDSYSLRGVRSRLKQWLYDAQANKEAVGVDTLLLHDDVEKLIEAARVIHKQETVQ